MQLLHGDCFELLGTIQDNTVDMVLCDLPYGLTDADWDAETLDLKKLKEEYLRVLKQNGVIVLFSIQPFTTDIMRIFKPYYSHTWYWKKNMISGGIFAQVQPMRCVEEIHVFRNSVHTNNKGQFPRTRAYMIDARERSGLSTKNLRELLGNGMASHYFTMGEQFTLPTPAAYEKLRSTGFFPLTYEDLKALYESEKPRPEDIELRYYPQGLKKLETPIIKSAPANSEVYKNKKNVNPQEFTGYPNNFLEYDSETDRVHPTQKPVALLEYFIKTYTRERETVLDNCMGSGSTGVAAVNTGRDFIGMELDKKYFDIASERITKARKE